MAGARHLMLMLMVMCVEKLGAVPVAGRIQAKSTEFGGSVVCFAGSAGESGWHGLVCLDGTKRSSTTEGHIQCGDAEGFLDEYVCGHSQHAWYGYSSWGPH